MPKYALITGCSLGGIGDYLSQEFHRQGVHVFASARSLERIAHLKSMGISTLELDVLSPLSIDAALSFINSKTGGKLDFLVNNSGRGKPYVVVYGSVLLSVFLLKKGL